MRNSSNHTWGNLLLTLDAVYVLSQAKNERSSAPRPHLMWTDDR